MARGAPFDLHFFTDAAASAAISDVARSAWKEQRLEIAWE
jgi:hypothetical protein